MSGRADIVKLIQGCTELVGWVQLTMAVERLPN
jgi:hypothetical protein